MYLPYFSRRGRPGFAGLSAGPSVLAQVLHHRGRLDQPVVSGLDARDSPGLEQPAELSGGEPEPLRSLGDGDVLLVGQGHSGEESIAWEYNESGWGPGCQRLAKTMVCRNRRCHQGMSEQCCAIWPTGDRCEHPGVVVDEARGGLVCHLHAPPGPLQQEALRAVIRKAMVHPDRYLAAALAEWTDEALAAELGCSTTWVWRLRLCGWPRVDRWHADVMMMAEALSAETTRLAALLRRLYDRPGQH